MWPNKNKSDVKDILNGMWENIGRNFGEIVHTKNYNPFTCKNTEIIGLNKIKNTIIENNNKKKE